MFTSVQNYIYAQPINYLLYQLHREKICSYNISCNAYNFSCEKPDYVLLIKTKQSKAKQSSLIDPIKSVNQKRKTESSIEQILLEKGFDPIKYRISNSEFNAALGIAQFSSED